MQISMYRCIYILINYPMVSGFFIQVSRCPTLTGVNMKASSPVWHWGWEHSSRWGSSLSLWSPWHGGFRVARLLTVWLTALEVWVLTQTAKGSQYCFLWQALGVSSHHFCHTLVRQAERRAQADRGQNLRLMGCGGQNPCLMGCGGQNLRLMGCGGQNLRLMGCGKVLKEHVGWEMLSRPFLENTFCHKKFISRNANI